MKKNIFINFVFCLLLFAGCGKDGITYEEGSTSTEQGEYGYLKLPQAIYVDTSSENFNQVQTKSSDTAEASDDYLVSITSVASATVVYSDTYAEFKKIDELELTPASYTLVVSSTAQVPDICDQAHFYVSENFSIVTGLTTTIDNLICTMSNIKVSVSFSADLLDLFQEDSADTPEQNLNVNITIGGNSVDYSRSTAGQVNYFKAVEVSNTLELTLSGMFNTAAEGEDPTYTLIEEWSQTIDGVKAGQWRNISINVEYAKEGNVDFTVTIDTWAYDKEIDVDITSGSYQISMAEPELDDPENYITDVDAPIVTQGQTGTSIDNIFYVDQSIFELNSSLQTVCTNPVILNVECQGESTLSELWVEIDTDNAAFASLLRSSLGDKRREYILPQTSSSESYTIDGNSVEATYSAMYKLYIYSGEHKVTIMAKDSEGRASYNYFTIISLSEGVDIPTTPPTIEWQGGYSFDEVYTIDDSGMDVVIVVTSQTGITGFTLEIVSDVLTPEALEGINLAANMDLVNPGDYKDGLEFLGFVTGDQVEGQTSLTIDISSFMPMLAGLGSGASNFILVVTDAGGTTTRTIQLNVE